jgi:hypothetical protein
LFTTIAALLVVATCSGCDPVWEETAVRHWRPHVEGEIFDPQEFDFALRDEFASVDREAEREVGNVRRDNKFIFAFWAAKKRLLEEHFHINWKSPAELNPQIEYDSYGQPKVTQAERKRIARAVRPRLGAKESIHAIWREFNGTINISTHSTADKESRIYYARGTDGKWLIKGPFLVQY